MKYLLENHEKREIDIEEISLGKNTKNRMLIFKRYYENISKEKEKIDQLENNCEWDRIKKLGNPFELIYTSYHKKKKRDSISNYQPISRSYFKMWEIYYNFQDKIFENLNVNEPFIFGHLAEGPGGFMEASYNYRNILLKNRPNRDVYYGITLRPNSEFVPDWNKIRSIFRDTDKFKIEYGNLYNLTEVRAFIKNFKNKKASIVTADGGFDYSSDFNGQEISSCQIIYSECIVAMNILKERGTFVCKVFDLFTSYMIRLIYFLYNHFQYVYLYKPETSRPANSEKYIVCIGYLNKLTDNDKKHLLSLIQEYHNFPQLIDNEVIDLNGINVPGSFVQSLGEYNEEYIEHQKYYLQKTIQLAYEKPTKEEYDLLIKNQVKNALDWCRKYHVPINQQSQLL